MSVECDAPALLAAWLQERRTIARNVRQALREHNALMALAGRQRTGRRGRPKDGPLAPETLRRMIMARRVEIARRAVCRYRAMDGRVPGEALAIACERINKRTGIPEGTLRRWWWKYKFLFLEDNSAK